MKNEDKTLHKIFFQKEGERKEEDYTLHERSLKRKFRGAFDSLENDILKEQRSLMIARKADTDTFEVNACIGPQQKIAKFREAQAAIQVEFKELFGEDFKTE